MALIIPGPFERFVIWLKRLGQGSGQGGHPPTFALRRTKNKTRTVWTKALDKDRRVEVIAREDGLFSFREMKKVRDGDDVFDLSLHESGLYDDLKEITLAVSDYILSDRGQRLGERYP